MTANFFIFFGSPTKIYEFGGFKICQKMQLGQYVANPNCARK
jgi:hypothetical protein